MKWWKVLFLDNLFNVSTRCSSPTQGEWGGLEHLAEISDKFLSTKVVKKKNFHHFMSTGATEKSLHSYIHVKVKLELVFPEDVHECKSDQESAQIPSTEAHVSKHFFVSIHQTPIDVCENTCVTPKVITPFLPSSPPPPLRQHTQLLSPFWKKILDETLVTLWHLSTAAWTGV